ncbi:hypothetical protein [Alicyclobacillus fodiniaquatilis]|uniref:Uncharacterized protein n=1 Tax=Alicyclobacillus fodiniaquatilis TaxID=1661150 RepID=A0ABW4JK14_9BACL
MSKFRSRKSVVISPVSELKEPKEYVKENLVRFSQANTYEDARTEWRFVEIIGSGSVGFTDHCEICNAQLRNFNCVIRNENNGKMLKVGSRCIRQFITLIGTFSIEATNQYMDNVEKEWDTLQTLRSMYNVVVKVDKPFARELHRFHKKLTELLRQRGQYPLHESSKPRDMEPILKNVFGFTELPPIKEQRKLFQILWDVSKLATIREHKRFRNIAYKEGETLNRKRSRVTHDTFARSEAYRPDGRYR